MEMLGQKASMRWKRGHLWRGLKMHSVIENWGRKLRWSSGWFPCLFEQLLANRHAVFVLFFEAGSHVTRAFLKLSLLTRMALNFLFSCFHLHKLGLQTCTVTPGLSWYWGQIWGFMRVRKNTVPNSSLKC